METGTDIRIERRKQEAVATVTPLSRRGREWVDQHVHVEGWQVAGESILAEPRMALAIADASRDAGLAVGIS